MSEPGSSAEGGADALAVDLNADVGEIPDPRIDLALLEVITSANIACGGHAGDRVSMARLCQAAVGHEVAIGAQVSFPDREGFGRRLLTIAPSQLRTSLEQQCDDLAEEAESAGGRVAYLKPHGALYHAAIDDPATAEVLVGLAATRGIPVLTMGFGHLRSQAEAAGVPVFSEAFLDRGYTADGRLASRDSPGAVLEAEAALDRLREWITHRFHGAHSLCVHSDSPDAVAVASRARSLLTERNIRMVAFTESSRAP